MEPLSESHAPQRFRRFLFVGHAVKILGQHHVFEGGQVRHQVVLLENESQLLRPEARPLPRRKRGEVLTFDDHAPRRRGVQTAENIEQSALA